MFSNLDKISTLLEEVSDIEIIPRFRNLTAGEVSYKKGGETVTIADTETEIHLSNRLKDLFPGCNVLGEEKVAIEPGVLENLDPNQLNWVIDPIDGTNNFTKGIEVFKCMLALVYKGETVAGWIYDPISKATLQARQGEGAFLNSTKLKVTIPSGYTNPDCIGTLHSSKGRDPVVAEGVEKNRAKLNVVKTLRCAGADYERLAMSQTQFSLYTRLMPWDHLPGVLIHKESGGYSACLDEQEYVFSSYRKNGLLLAPDQEIWKEIHAALFS